MTRTTAARPPLDPCLCLVIEDRCAPSIVDRILGEIESFLQRTARHIAADNPSVTDDLVQEARITLWELDLGRFAQRDAAYLKRILCTRMVRAYRRERRGGLTTGWSKHRAGDRGRRSTQRTPARVRGGDLARPNQTLHDS